jgi:hypothetical protein
LGSGHAAVRCSERLPTFHADVSPAGDFERFFLTISPQTEATSLEICISCAGLTVTDSYFSSGLFMVVRVLAKQRPDGKM